MTDKSDERKALEALVEWIADPRFEQWDYIENAQFYYDRREHLAKSRAVLATAPAEPPKDGEAPPLVRQPKMARQEGWICPACRRVNGPQVRECACRGNLTLGERLRRSNA